MKIFFTGKNYSQGLKDVDPSSLAAAAESLGHQLVQSLEENPDLLICVDFQNSSAPLIKRANSLGIWTVLVINEPQVVIPEHSQERVLKNFDNVIRVGRPSGSDSFPWPQTWLSISENRKRMKRAVLVNADKWSYVEGQHYWLRAAASSELDIVDVFGVGWDRTVRVRLAHRIYELWRTLRSRVRPSFRGMSKILATPRAYMGSVSDKNEAMSRYKVALIIENSSEFLTEKLFDAWFAGCIPVYVGPLVESFGIPNNLVVQIREPSLLGVEKGIETALSRDADEFLAELRKFLNSNAARKWKSQEALERIIYAALQK